MSCLLSFNRIWFSEHKKDVKEGEEKKKGGKFQTPSVYFSK